MWLLLWVALSSSTTGVDPVSEQGIQEAVRQALLPRGSWVEHVGDVDTPRGEAVKVVLGTDGWWLAALTEGVADDLQRCFVGKYGRGVDVQLWFLDPESGMELPLTSFLPPVAPVERKAWEVDGVAHHSPIFVPDQAPGMPKGFLNGKHVYVSQGHGWTWSDTLDAWTTQRGNTHGAVEDFLNAEAINQYLIQYLENAGATVFAVREHDMNPEMVVIDNEDGTSNPDNGLYEEFGPFETSTAPGFGTFTPPYASGVALFSAGTTRFAWTEPGSQTNARFTPRIPVDGYYTVSISWSASGNRTSSAKVLVRHAGGETTYIVDQKRHGGTWITLGRFYFRAGLDADLGAVVVSADAPSEAENRVVSVDAVKFGGGRGVIKRGTGNKINTGPTTGRPRWEENCRYASQFNGAPSSVYDYSSSDGSDDVSSRSRYAAWQHEEGEDAVFVSWHTNAPSPGTGTSTYVYGPNEPNGSYDFTGVAGSDKLAEFIHDEVVLDIRAEYDSNWADRGIYSAWFGELNPSHNDEMPSALVEVGFHDTQAECLKMQDPKFRALVARAFYQGIVRYFAWKDSKQAIFVPDGPVGFSVTTLPDGRTRLAWQPAPSGPVVGSDPPESYRVYSSSDGRSFDNGVEAGSGTEYVVGPLEPGKVYYYRVTAVNDGGESFPSPTLATSRSASGKRAALIVAAFERLDRLTLIPEDLSAWNLGTVQRMLLHRINRFDHIVEHAEAFKALGIPFDSAWRHADVLDVQLGTYRFIDWFVGRNSTQDEALTGQERSLIQAFLAGGGHLLLSGTEIGWDLVEKGSPEEQEWFETWLRAGYLSDESGQYTLMLGAAALTLDDGTKGTYNSLYCDVLEPLDGGAALVTYGDGQVAATAWKQGEQGVALLGFPFETVVGLDARAMLLGAVLEALELTDLASDPVDPVEPVEDVIEPPETDIVEQPDLAQEELPFNDLQAESPSDTASSDVAVPKETSSGDLVAADTWVTYSDCKGGSCAAATGSGDGRAAATLVALALLLMALRAVRLRFRC